MFCFFSGKYTHMLKNPLHRSFSSSVKRDRRTNSSKPKGRWDLSASPIETLFIGFFSVAILYTCVSGCNVILLKWIFNSLYKVPLESLNVFVFALIYNLISDFRRFSFLSVMNSGLVVKLVWYIGTSEKGIEEERILQRCPSIRDRKGHKLLCIKTLVQWPCSLSRNNVRRVSLVQPVFVFGLGSLRHSS